MSAKILTKNQLARMPQYLITIKKFKGKGLSFINAQLIADDLNLNVEQVKKDLASVATTNGVPNKGREINGIIRDIESVLGYDDIHNAILIGVGHLGSALLNYAGFEEYGLKIVGAFDSDEAKIGTKINGVRIYDIRVLKNVFKDYNAKIGIITTPKDKAQEVANVLVYCGVLAIWNFAPIDLNIKDSDVILSNMNMATSLAVLSHQLYLKKEKANKTLKSFDSK